MFIQIREPFFKFIFVSVSLSENLGAIALSVVAVNECKENVIFTILAKVKDRID